MTTVRVTMNDLNKVNRARALEKSGASKTEILELLEAAADEGNPEAVYALGTFYLHGKYYSKDKRRGISLIKKAAGANWRDAVFDFAVALETGDGIEKDEETSFNNYLKAMILGDINSSEEVARCFYYGIGIKKNKDAFERIMDIVDALRDQPTSKD